MDRKDVGGDRDEDLDCGVITACILYGGVFDGREIVDRCAGKWCDRDRIRYIRARIGVEWTKLRGDRTRNGEYTRLFYGRDGDVARIGEFRVLYMGARDYMGRAAVDGDGARDKHSRVFYQR